MLNKDIIDYLKIPSLYLLDKYKEGFFVLKKIIFSKHKIFYLLKEANAMNNPATTKITPTIIPAMLFPT